MHRQRGRAAEHIQKGKRIIMEKATSKPLTVSLTLRETLIIVDVQGVLACPGAHPQCMREHVLLQVLPCEKGEDGSIW